MVRKNLGKRDRFLWFIIGLILITVAIFKVDSILFKWVLAFFGGFFIVEGLIGFSVCYYIVGFSSRGIGLNRISKREIELAIKKNKINPVIGESQSVESSDVVVKKSSVSTKSHKKSSKSSVKKKSSSTSSSKKKSSKSSASKKSSSKKTSSKSGSKKKSSSKKKAATK